MLDTIIELGKIFRENKDLSKHHLIKNGYEPGERYDHITYWNIPVDNQMNLDIENRIKIPENQRLHLLYLNFKTSGQDSSKKYIFGDIFRAKLPKEQNERLNFKTGAKNSFIKGKEYEKEYEKELEAEPMIKKFRKSFEENLETIVSLIESKDIYLHFDFNGKNWYQLEKEFGFIKKLLHLEFTERVKIDNKEVFVLNKSLIKTLNLSHKLDRDRNISTIIPGLKGEEFYKNRFFRNSEEIESLFFGVDFSTSPIISNGDLKIIALPKGSDLSAENIERFFSSKGLDNHKTANEELEPEQELFAPLTNNSLSSEIQFDIIISKKGGSGPDVDLVEINRIRKSVLIELHERIKNVKKILIEKYKNAQAKKREKYFEEILQRINKLQILSAFSEILGDLTKDKKKYQSHLLKTIPKIYTGNYLEDPVLLPAFIEKCQFNIRNAGTGFIDSKRDYSFLKHDYIFLTLIRNNKKGEEEMKKMEESNSYAIGHSLGEMARPLSSKIASFEKNYVGLLSRRIVDLNSFLQFFNYISEKLAIHNALYPNLKEKAMGITDKVKKMESKDYAKNYVSFGFFEGYFSPLETKTEGSSNEED